MDYRILIVVSLILLVGCSHICQFSHYDEINARTKGKDANLLLLNGTNIKGNDILMTADSTYWFQQPMNIKQSVSTSEVHKLILVNRGRGAWYGCRMFLGHFRSPNETENGEL